MIPNITHSTGSGNYLGYDLGDKKEQYQKVQFLAAEGVMFDDRLIDRLNRNWEDGDEKGYQAFRKVSMAIANDLDDQFRAQASLNGRPKIRAINVSLSYSPEDTDKVNEVVYDETRDDYVPLRLKMGRAFLDGMGFGDIQYVAVSHLGTHCAHDHYAINTVRADGSTIKLNFDFVRAQKIAADIREKYGLTPPDESLQMIAPKAKDALKQSCSWEEYGQRLQGHGIGVVYSDHSKNGRGYGVSYSFNKKVIPGSKLHRSLTYGRVEATLARNLAARRAQEEASRIAAQQELARQKAEAEAKAAAEKAAEEARLAAEKAAQEAARKAREERRRAAEEKDFIRRYVNSDKLKALLDFVNGGFDETHYDLVPGRLVETETGMRLVLYSDGFRSTSGVLYHEHEPAPQDHGESYIDFSVDAQGHLIAAVECDPTNHYTYGISGKLNLGTGKGSIARRDFRGSLEAREQKIKDNYAKYQGAEKKPRKHKGPKR